MIENFPSEATRHDMAAMSPGTALRNLQQAQAGLKKVRQLLRLARESGGDVDTTRILKAGWEGLAKAHRMLAEIPVEAATEPVMTRQLAVQRYATALLVRLRRLARNEPGALDGEADDEADDDEA
jgi:hypothetical protein